MMRFPAIVTMLMVGATFACARGPASQANVPTPSVVAPHGLVYVSVGGRIEALEMASGQVVSTPPTGTPSPDWRRVYTVGQGRPQHTDAATGPQVGRAAARARPHGAAPDG